MDTGEEQLGHVESIHVALSASCITIKLKGVICDVMRGTNLHELTWSLSQVSLYKLENKNQAR